MRKSIVLAACALAAGLVVPAHAQQGCPEVLDCAVAGPGSVTITVTGAYTGVLVNGLQVVANCDAVAVGAVSAIVIDQCYLTSNPDVNAPSTAPGNATASALTERVDTLAFNLCYHAYAIPELDPTNPAEAGGCANGLPGVGGLGGGGVALGSN